MKILVVDDDPMVTRLVARILENEAAVSIASNQQDAKAIFNKDKFDVVLIDVNLGDENGIDLAVRFRDLDPLLQVTVMSGDITNMQRVRDVGLGELLLKPFTSAELKARLPL